MPRRAIATQEQEPARTTIRTIFQAVLGIIIGSGIVLPLAVIIIQEELGEWIPAEWLAVMATAAAVAVGVSGVVTRIMAIPAVNDALRRVGLGAGHNTEGSPR